MKALITGIEGFVGGYLKKELQVNGFDVFGIDAMAGQDSIKVNILNKKDIERTLLGIEPDYIIHLAGQADVGKSWLAPTDTFEINVIGTVNLLEAVRTVCKKSRVIIIGSSDEYGVLEGRGMDVTEETWLNPVTPYAISKVAQEQMALTYVHHYDMDICMTRSFNHAGAGQKKGFMISDFASGVVEVERGLKSSLKVGNLESSRDFTHVKDVVRAYRLIAEKGRKGEIYNVGSGKAYKASDILEQLINISTKKIVVETDEKKLRPSDTPVICCNHSKLTNHTGWEPQYTIEDILADVMAYWRNIITVE